MIQRLGRGQFELHISPLPRPGSPLRPLPGTPYHSLADWLASAGERLRADAQPSPFDRFDWFDRTERLAGTVRHPLILESADGLAWLPLDRRGLGQASSLGSWYTLAYRPVFADACPSASGLEGLARAARESRLSRLVLGPVPDWDGSAAGLVAGFRAAGWHARVAEKTGNWVEPVAGLDWATYLSRRPGRLRSTIQRKARHAGLTTEIHGTVNDALWSDYTAVFAESWKGEEGSLPFLRDLADQAAASGALRLGFARLDGTVVATQLWTVDGATATIHKLAYRESAREMSAGTVLSAAMFRDAIDGGGVALIDYGTGDDAYKRDWMTQRRRLMTVTLTDPRSAAGLAWLARDRLSRLVAAGRSG